MIKISKGLDLPIEGKPEQVIHDGPKVNTVAVLGPDFVGMRPSMCVKVGDRVKLGQTLFIGKKIKGVKYTAPGAGEVIEVNRGERRSFLSVTIALDGSDNENFEQFDAYTDAEMDTLDRGKVVDNLVNSGLWTAFRTRPYNKVPELSSSPSSIFVTAMDTNPLAADPTIVIKEDEDHFVTGLKCLTRLTEGKVYICQKPNSGIPRLDGTSNREFDGPHPAGLAGTHIHFLDPVSENKTVWVINYQDVIAFGKLFLSGRLHPERIVAIGGPGAKNPRLVRTRRGAAIKDLVKDEVKSGEQRIISGSVLNGTTAEGPLAYLGRYHLQITIVPEKREREFFASLTGGEDRFSITRGFLSSLIGGRQAQMNTSQYGSKGNILSIGTFDKVMPLDIMPDFLLRSLAAGDTDEAQALGCLELVEEDLALCTYVCPGKNDYGVMLRDVLTTIEKEG